MRTAVLVSAAWVAAGTAFGLLLIPWQGGSTATEYFAAYLIEKALSVDNLFVFALLFRAFAVPSAYQHRVLFAGVLGALALRGGFIAAGAALLEHLSWAFFAFGALLLAAALRMARGGMPADSRPDLVPRGLRKILPASENYNGMRFFTRRDGRLSATPLLAALVAMATTDVEYAIDSIPAALVVTTDLFVVFTANAFAVLGLRALYFVLAGAMERFTYLSQGLAVMLPFIGAKMILAGVLHVPTAVSLGVVIVIIASAILLSVWKRRSPRPKRLGGSVASERQGHQDPGALRRGAGHLDPAVVGADKLGDDGEADAAARGHRGRLPAPEPVEDQRQLVGGDTETGVRHAQHRAPARRPGLERHPPAGRGELERVAQQVGDHLMNPRGVRHDRDRR
jgi:tellurite resistance protein TerC